ncbi:MAG: tRNA uridine-5-carboxymethylaminomethyl(34) synthesis GTPase MnmE [Candidatus Omnitrophica bacterium]|nr:tRNA uridine-5-carboxymethylaminomethyl(34) synthesis GTPase MnmE [Candidatus Omnitrophota bacterium]
MNKDLLKDYSSNDTIAAIATFPASSALGVIKISGKKAVHIMDRIFMPKKNKEIKKVKSYTLHYGWIIDRTRNSKGKAQSKNKKKQIGSYGEKAGNIVDEVLVSMMKAPYSYTKEDVVEVSSHGGMLVINKILGLILRQGARLANPGEFTYRAFINGRIDLIQAQGILEVMEAKTEEALLLASRQLKGEFSENLVKVNNKLKDIFIKVEADLQFPENGIEISPAKITREVRKAKKYIDDLIKTSAEADVIREGINCVICGKANTGKSTLFNRLLKKERAIVAETAGTTRDVIEENINIKGIPLRMYDTAGILEPRDFVEKKALEKSYQKIKEADIILLLLSYSQPLEKDDIFLWEKVKKKNTLVVINKIDLEKKIEFRKMNLFKRPKIKLSALKGIGLNELEEKMFKSVYRKGINKKDRFLFLARKQKDILGQVSTCLFDSLHYLTEGYSIDFLSFSLKEALDKLGKLTGKVTNESILKDIFSNFCIGK